MRQPDHVFFFIETSAFLPVWQTSKLYNYYQADKKIHKLSTIV